MFCRTVAFSFILLLYLPLFRELGDPESSLSRIGLPLTLQ